MLLGGMMNKKLIGFDEKLLEKVEKYSKKQEITFTNAVRQLIELGYASSAIHREDTDNVQGESDSVDLITVVKRLEKLEKDRDWWNTDDIQSRIGNLELEQKNQEKKINVLTRTAKLFKGHLNNREIHLQD